MDDRQNVRARALRAARVVTLGLAMATTPGCGESHVGGQDSGAPIDSGSPEDSGTAIDGAVADSGGAVDSGGPLDSGPSDSGPIDSGIVVADAGQPDSGSDLDSGLVCPPVFPPTTRECCEATPGGFWDESTMECYIAVPGPFVPPSEHARV